MTGEQMHRVQVQTAIDLGVLPVSDFVRWEDLPAFEQYEWELRAYEQDLRDRAIPATLTDD